MDKKIRIGMVQFEGKLGDIHFNVAHAQDLIGSAVAQGANIVCLPELFATGYNLDLLKEKAISLSSAYYEYIVTEMSAAAKTHGIHLIAPVGRKTEMEGILTNSALLFGPWGELRGYFDKSHLWALERFYFKEGNDYPIFDIKLSDITIKIGIMICYDAGFPEVCRSLALQGAEIVFCPAAWRIQDVDMWDLNLSQRALENILFVVGVNRFGREGDLELFGKSKICNPRGRILKELPMDKECVDVFEIDLAEVEHSRIEIPYLRDRKPQIYTKLLE